MEQKGVPDLEMYGIATSQSILAMLLNVLYIVYAIWKIIY